MASENITFCSRRIAEKGLKVAIAESATAGRLASEFALTPNSGDIFLGGIVCYDACTKEELFGIPNEIIKQFSAESAEVTRLLAEGLGKYFKCDIGVAVTGLIGPGGSETEDKPIGTMFIHISLPEERYCAHREVFNGKPEEIIAQAVERTGELISACIDNLPATAIVTNGTTNTH